jgi:aminomethyltransferase
MILNKNGGIVDDTIVTRRVDYVHMVVNGGNKFIDLEHMKKLKTEYNLHVDINYLADKPLIAVQGPKASELLSRIIDPSISKLSFMNMLTLTVDGIDYQINRCGYTGEDGFEVSVEDKHIV